MINIQQRANSKVDPGYGHFQKEPANRETANLPAGRVFFPIKEVR